MDRVSKHNYYLDIAQTVAERGTCLRRTFGAIIVKDDVIVSTGYNGAPRGRKNCCDLNYCMRDKLNIPRGERYELCRSVHAEANAIIAAARERMLGATLYMVKPLGFILDDKHFKRAGMDYKDFANIKVVDSFNEIPELTSLIILIRS